MAAPRAGPRARPRPARRPVAPAPRRASAAAADRQASIGADPSRRGRGPAARLRGELRAARRQVDQPSGAACWRPWPPARAGSAAPATARTCARRPAIVAALGATRRAVGRATAGGVDYRVVSPGADGLPRTRRTSSTAATPGRACGSSTGRARRPADDRDPRRRRFVASPSGGSYHRTAALDGRGAPRPASDDSLPPLTVVGHTPLRAMDYTTPVPSAQVKSAILLAGLRAEGRTTVREAVATRDHTERMLRARGRAGRADGRRRTAAWPGRWKEGWRCRRSTSGSRATSRRRRSGWSPAPSIPTPSSTLRDVGVNPTRRAVHRHPAVDGRRHRGAAGTTPAADDGVGEPMADLRRALVGRSGPSTSARPTSPRRSTRSRSCAWPRPRPTGTTVIRGAGELRHKESDRIAGIAAGLRALGRRVEVDGDDLRISGGDARSHGARHRQPRRPPPGDDVRDRRPRRQRRDRRSADPASAAISYPGFFDDLERVRA